MHVKQRADNLSIDNIYREVEQHYAISLATYGASPRGVDWKDDASHRTRHSQFLRLFGENRNASIIDLGCGYGDFLTFLRNQGYEGAYIGYDVSQSMIDCAREKHNNVLNSKFVLGTRPSEKCDYAIASGILNVRRGTDEAGWASYAERIIDQLASCSIRGFGFNALSLSSDPEMRREDLYYADPTRILALCLTNYGRHVCLLQDYHLWEFTMLVHHSSHTANPKPDAP